MPPFTSKTLTLNKRPLFLFLHHHPFTTTHNRPFEDTSRNVRVSVWWDFENCGVPAGANVYRVAQWITAAVRGNGIKGPIQINAFGDVFLLLKAVQVGLSVTGVNLSHVPGGNQNSLDRPLLVDLMYWVSQNPPPAHLFIISGDKGMAGVLHRLRMNNYNILLACQDGPPNVLCSAASIMWRWNDLVRGENLAGKHFNLPPDGPFHSWYGNFKVPLEDPFTATETPCFSQNEDSIDELSSDAKIRQVPKVVLNAIQRIVNSYANGLSITDLRAALVDAKVHIDKDFYGHRKFSCFLSSMPKILKVHPRGDGQFLITAVSPRVVEPLELNSGVSDGTVAGGKIQDSASPKANSEVESVVKVVDENPPVTFTLKSKPGASDGSSGNHRSQESKAPERNDRVNPESEVADKNNKISSSFEANKKVKIVKEDSNRRLGLAEVEESQGPPTEDLSSAGVTEARVAGNRTISLEKQGSAAGAKFGILRRAWAKMFSRNISDQNTRVSETRDQVHSNGEFELSNSLQDGSTGSSADSAASANSGSMDVSSDVAKREASGDLKGDMTKHGVVNESNASSGFVTKVIGWCKFWKRKSDVYVSSQPLDTKSKETSGMGKDGLFMTDSLWKDTESFIESCKGSSIISNSRSREDIAQDLQKTGPVTLQSLSMADLLHLVDLLITEKKCIEECLSQTYPFRVIHLNQGNEVPSPTQNSNGLSSIFQRPSSKQSDTSELAEHHEEKKAENLPRSGVGRKQGRKSRTEILTDCRKLSEALLKASPEGFKVRSFRKLFVESYGYVLDHEKLGYPKLDSLLQIIPGVKVESGYARLIKSTPRVDHDSSKGDDIESPWEELGPVEDAGDSKKEVNRDSSKVEYDYESSLSDDELSDSELESSPLSQVEAQNNPATDGNDSSLLQILDSWYSNKEVNNSKDGAEDVDDTATSPRHGCSKPKDSSQISVKQGNLKTESSFDPDRRRGPAKSYSFVADSAEKEKDQQLIDGILGTLKKAGEPKLQV